MQRVGIIGLGYVGLPLAVAFAEEGLDVVAVEVDQSKLASIKKCRFEKRPRDSADENGEARRGSENGLDSNLDDNPDEFCDWNQAIDLGGRAESAHHSDMYDFG